MVEIFLGSFFDLDCKCKIIFPFTHVKKPEIVPTIPTSYLLRFLPLCNIRLFRPWFNVHIFRVFKEKKLICVIIRQQQRKKLARKFIKGNFFFTILFDDFSMLGSSMKNHQIFRKKMMGFEAVSSIYLLPISLAMNL